MLDSNIESKIVKIYLIQLAGCRSLENCKAAAGVNAKGFAVSEGPAYSGTRVALTCIFSYLCSRALLEKNKSCLPLFVLSGVTYQQLIFTITDSVQNLFWYVWISIIIRSENMPRVIQWNSSNIYKIDVHWKEFLCVNEQYCCELQPTTLQD